MSERPAGGDNPLASTRLRAVGAAIVFVAALALYTATLAPTVTLVDSGELIIAARTLGVAHPPGFPLYVLLAHIATMFPFGTVALRVNFVSALFAALAAATLTLLVSEVLLAGSLVSARKRATKSRRKKRRGDGPASELKTGPSDPSLPPILAMIPCVAAGLLFACSRTLWGYGTIAEVYTLNTFLILVIFLLMFRWRRRILGDGSGLRASGVVRAHDRWLNAAAFVFGLALGVHHVSVGLMLPALAWLVLATEGLGFFKSRRLALAAAFAFLGLGIYLYLPLAAARSPLMNWGDPRTLQQVWWHITGRQYQEFIAFSPEIIGRQMREFFTLAGREFGPTWLPVTLGLAALGFIGLFRRDRVTFWFLVIAVGFDFAYNMNYEIAEDKDAYYLPVFLTIAAAAGFGVNWIMKGDWLGRFSANTTRALAVLVSIAVPVTSFGGSLPFNNRSRYFIARDYVQNIFNSMEPGGMLLTLDWQVYSPMLYVREEEKQRTDVVAIDINQLRRSWYFGYLSQVYPETIERSRDKVEAFLEDLRHWEQDPNLYERDVSLNQRIGARFNDMIISFVKEHIRSAPVYVTQDVATIRSGRDADLTAALAQTYQFIPAGLAFKLEIGSGFHDVPSPELVTRGLTDGAIKFEADDVVKQKVLPVYARMAYNRGRYLAANGQHERAVEAFRQALGFDSNFSAAKQALGESLAALRGGAARQGR